MGWKEPSLPSIKATCDQCGHKEDVEAWNTPAGHWVYPQPGERGSNGWDYREVDGKLALLCPDCFREVQDAAV